MIFSKRLAFAKKYGFDLTAEFNALVCDVEKTEREECAKACKSISDKYAFGHYGNEVDTADECEMAIRARDFI